MNFNQRITPNPYPLDNAILRTEGLYKFVRHPLYLSVLIIIIGWCMYSYSIISILCPIAALIFLIFKIKFEEKQLNDKFPEYKEYQKRSYHFYPIYFLIPANPSKITLNQLFNFVIYNSFSSIFTS